MVDNEFNRIPKFIKRLYREVSDNENKWICWSSDGDKIRIADKEKFVKCTLPKLSKTKEYSGFVRQLNIYGFVKIKSDRNEDIEEYYSSYFKRDEPELMEHMKRIKKHEKSGIKINQAAIENSLAYLTSSNYRLTNEVTVLKERVEKQERTINGLLEILGKVFRTGIQNINFENKLSKMSSDFSSNILGAREEKSEYENKKQPDFTTGLLGKQKELKKGFLSGKVIEESNSEDKNSQIIKDMNDIFF